MEADFHSDQASRPGGREVRPLAQIAAELKAIQRAYERLTGRSVPSGRRDDDAANRRRAGTA